MTEKKYYHGIDAIRAVLLLFGPVIHAATLVHTQPLPILGVSYLSNNTRMPCFFMLSGFVAGFANVDSKWFAKRFRTLGLPLFFGWLFVLPLCHILSPEVLPDDRVFSPQLPIALEPLHLWFLLDLILFSALLLLFRKWGVETLLASRWGNLAGVAIVCCLGIVFSMMSALAMSAFAGADKLTSIWLSIVFRIPEYFCAYLLGHLIYRFNLLPTDRPVTPYVIISMICALIIALFGIYASGVQPLWPRILAHIVVPFVTFAIGIILVLIGVNHNKQSTIIKFLSASAFVIYVFHMLGLAIADRLLVGIDGYSFIISATVLSLLFSVLAYYFIRANRTLRWMFSVVPRQMTA